MFIPVPGENRKGYGDAVHVHKKPHAYDWQWPVFLAFAELFIVPGSIHFKVEVCAIVIDDLCIAFLQGRSVLKETALDIVRFFCDYGQSAINVVKFKGRLFQESFGFVETAPFGGRIENSCIDQTGEDLIQIILKKVPSGDCAAYFVQAKFVINVLKKKISSIESSLLVHNQIGSGTEFHVELCGVFFFCFIHKSHLFFCPCFGIGYTVCFTDMLFGTKGPDDLRLVFSIDSNGFYCSVGNRIFSGCPS